MILPSIAEITSARPDQLFAVSVHSIRVWLLQNEFPFVSAVEALLVAFDVKFPVAVEVA